MSDIAIIGAGAWGTALSVVLGRAGKHKIRLWAHEPEISATISRTHVNTRFLPGQEVPACVQPCSELEQALKGAGIVIGAVPSQHCRKVFESARPFIVPGAVLVSATKGLEERSLLRMTQVIAQAVGGESGQLPVGALSGPSFAVEAARGDPTAVAIASTDESLARNIQRELGTPTFRIYTNSDPIGVELGGALKNTIAIAAGVSAGLELGHNSIAALITRGLAEMTRLVVACGGKADTMAGLAGLGDLVLTCTGGLSRNRSVGYELGRGRALADILSGMHGMVAEGIFTTNAAVDLAAARHVEMPITHQIQAILYRQKPPLEAIRELMNRSGKSENP